VIHVQKRQLRVSLRYKTHRSEADQTFRRRGREACRNVCNEDTGLPVASNPLLLIGTYPEQDNSQLIRKSGRFRTEREGFRNTRDSLRLMRQGDNVYERITELKVLPVLVLDT
jgi:hypothetical protein